MSHTTASSATDIVAAALHAGTRAPSPHNTQPWEFRVHGETIEVLLDDTRVLGYCDPEAREATLACGAAVFNMRMAIAEQGRECVVEPLPDRARPLLLARVTMGGQRRPTPEEQRLASAVERRHTNRRPFLDREIPVAARHALTRAAAAEGTRLVLLDQAQRFDEFVALLRHADHVQQQDPRFQAELRAWTHGGERDDGVPKAAGGPRAADGGLLALRDFGGDVATEREFERRPLVAVLTTRGDTRLDMLRAGQAMQRVLLSATSAGLNASFLAQPIEVGSVRERLRELLGGHEQPQTALRLGYGYPSAATPRRPVEDVTREGPP